MSAAAAIWQRSLHKKGVMSLRLSGPLFFGGASQVSRFFKTIQDAPKVLILRMGYVPVVDATGANIIVEFVKKLRKTNTKIIFSNVKKQPRRVLPSGFFGRGDKLPNHLCGFNF